MNIIELFNSVPNVKLDNGNVVSTPSGTATFAVRKDDKLFLVGIQGTSSGSAFPYVLVNTMDDEFQTIEMHTSAMPDAAEFKKVFGFGLEKSGNNIVCNGGQLVDVSKHFRYGVLTPSFSVTLEASNKFPVTDKNVKPPFPNCKALVVGCENDAYNSCGLLKNYLSAPQVGYLLSNTIYNEKGEHGLYSSEITSGVKSGKFPYYIVVVYPNVDKTIIESGK